MKNPEIERIVVLGKFDDGTIRQIFIKQKNEKPIMEIILQAIFVIDGSLSVSDTPLEGITVTESHVDEKPPETEITEAETRCIAVTCIPCDHPYINKESPEGCCNCGMFEWHSAFKTEEECNAAYKKQYPNEFDKNGKYIKK
jgi:hypothetical protein